jgi:hypothetical protein
VLFLRLAVTNADIAATFEQVADLLEYQGDNVFRVRAYRNAARVAAAVLAPLEARQQRVDEPVIRIRVRVGDEGVDDRRLRRQAGEIEREPPGQRPAIGLGRGCETFGFEPGQNEPVDRIPDPALVLDGGRFRPLGRQERPMRLVLGPLGDPPLEEVFLLGRERLLQARGRHHLVSILGKDPVEHDARIGVSRNDRAALDGVVPLVEAEIGLAAGAVGAVAGETVLHEDRADVPVEREPAGRLGISRQAAARPGQREPDRR